MRCTATETELKKTAVSCNVLCSEVKTLLQTSDYVVIQVVKGPDTGNVREQIVV
jgi:hypothetical protein